MFVFQAGDGIRDRNVTGVQTCALPISWGRTVYSVARPSVTRNAGWTEIQNKSGTTATSPQAAISARGCTPRSSSSPTVRSEERRVGKEGRSRGGRAPDRKKVEATEKVV